MTVAEKKKILFVVNKTKSGAEEIAKRLSSVAEANDFEASLCVDFPLPESVFENKDVCCVIGGDGTILSCVPHLVKFDLPVFGINLGKLGFLATYNDKISDEDFVELLNSGRKLERAILEAKCEGKSFFALNDLVIKDSRINGISNLRICVDSEFVADYLGDGLIFATPTGSTAYNMSAGGPIIHPKSRSFVMTPICPHTLSNRSLIFDSAANIRVGSATDEVMLMADGAEVARLKGKEIMEISMPAFTVNFIRLSGHSHFSILRNKLGWAEDPRYHKS